MWAYARENNLKDPKDGRFLLPDDLMRIVIPVQRYSRSPVSRLCIHLLSHTTIRISGFQMSKYLEKHMRPKPVTADELRERERETKEKAERERTRKESKKPPNPNGVFMRPVHVSEELQVVVGEAEVGAAVRHVHACISRRHSSPAPYTPALTHIAASAHGHQEDLGVHQVERFAGSGR